MKRITTNKINSIIIITLIYILAIIASIIIYNKLSYSIYINILIADIIATLIVYVFSVVFDNASIYDPYWSVQPIVIALGYSIRKNLNISSILVLIAITIWGVRLTLNWAYTFSDLTKQDWRYTKYKNETGKFYQIVNLFGIHMMPTILVFLATIPVIEIIDSNIFNLGSIIGFIISLCAVILQGTADYQMHRYRRKKNHKLIREGLWKYSRHPNYLGEILMWWGIAIQGISITGKIWNISGAMLITILFLTISIPLADKRQSKKEEYNKYKEETRSLFPIPKRT